MALLVREALLLADPPERRDRALTMPTGDRPGLMGLRGLRLFGLRGDDPERGVSQRRRRLRSLKFCHCPTLLKGRALLLAILSFSTSLGESDGEPSSFCWPFSMSSASPSDSRRLTQGQRRTKHRAKRAQQKRIKQEPTTMNGKHEYLNTQTNLCRHTSSLADARRRLKPDRNERSPAVPSDVCDLGDLGDFADVGEACDLSDVGDRLGVPPAGGNAEFCERAEVGDTGATGSADGGAASASASTGSPVSSAAVRIA